MASYSIKRNLNYMVKTFYRPKSLISGLLNEDLLLYYAIVPLIMFTGFYEVLYILSFISNQPILFQNFLYFITSSLEQYHLIQVIIFPIVHLIDYFIFYFFLLIISKCLKNYNIDSKRTALLGMFSWNTIGILAAIIDLISFFWPWEYWMFIHPICGIIGTLYGMEIIHQQSEINKWKAFFIYLIPFIVFLSFRMLFLG